MALTAPQLKIAALIIQIGQQRGVAHLLEGSVQRAGGKVRVNAQLIDARSDAHQWAENFDRDLADVFAIQSEIAKAIADQLQAKLSPSEKTAIEQRPTSDVTAFDLYNRAKNILLTTSFNANVQPLYFQAVDLLNQAITRDPSFFEAYCELAYADDNLYFLGNDHTPARLALAEAAIPFDPMTIKTPSAIIVLPSAMPLPLSVRGKLNGSSEMFLRTP